MLSGLSNQLIKGVIVCPALALCLALNIGVGAKHNKPIEVRSFFLPLTNVG
jgi:hypothetical protein